MGHSASHKKLIWKVFGILSVITAVEVAFGIVKPDVLAHSNFLWDFMPDFAKSSGLNWIFIILTLVKAYYIIWFFMHLGDETKVLRYAIVLPLMIYILYLTGIILIEAEYTRESIFKYILWKYH